jgi:hypothetical protein
VLWFVGTLRIERNYDGLPMWYSNSWTSLSISTSSAPDNECVFHGSVF